MGPYNPKAKSTILDSMVVEIHRLVNWATKAVAFIFLDPEERCREVCAILATGTNLRNASSDTFSPTVLFFRQKCRKTVC